jgi:hypothetical protein
VTSCNPATGSSRCYAEYKAGGRVTVRVRSARSLPNLDSFSGFSVETDAYAIVSIGEIRRRTSEVRNSLNPVWPNGGDALDFGVRDSGTVINVELWDSDTGLEFDNDKVGSFSTAVIACSQFLGKECSERSFFPLDPTRPCYRNNNVSLPILGAPCVEVEISVEPFEVEVTETFVPGMPRIIDIANEFVDAPSLTPDGALIYSQSAKFQIDANFPDFQPAVGGMIVRTRNGDRTSAVTQYISFHVNFRCVVYVFRRQNFFEETEPSWLNPNSGFTLTSRPRVRMSFQGATSSGGSIPETSIFHAYAKEYSPNSTVTLGGAMVGTNGIVPESMYAVVVRHIPDSATLPNIPTKTFDRAKFMELFLEFQLPNIILALFLANVLSQVRYDTSLVESWLISRILPDPPDSRAHEVNRELGTFSAEDRQRMSLIAALFMSHGATDRNVAFRRHLFWTAAFARALLLAPLIITLAHGIVTTIAVRPPQVGWGVMLIGEAIWLALYAVGRWRHSAWRMDGVSLALLGVAMALVLLYLVVLVFVDPLGLSVFSLTAVFLLLNFLPIVWIAFNADPGLRTSLDKVASAARRNARIGKARSKISQMHKMGLLQRLKAGAAARPASPEADMSGLLSALGGTDGKDDATFPNSASGFGGVVEGVMTTAFMEAQAAWDTLKTAASFPNTSDAKLEAIAKQMKRLIESKPWLGLDTDASAAAAAAVDGGKQTVNLFNSGSSRKGAGGALAALLGEAYSIDANAPGGFFTYSDPLAGFLALGGNVDESVSTKGMSDLQKRLNKAKIAGQKRRRSQLLKTAYLLSVLSLFVLCIVSWAHVRSEPNAGIAASLTVLAGDSAVFFALRSGKVDWTPGYLCFLLGLTRGVIVLFSGTLWLAGVSLAYAIWGCALVVQIVNRALPRMTEAAAGAVAYLDADQPRVGISFSRASGQKAKQFGSGAPQETEQETKKRLDMSGSPEFVLSYLTILFILTLIGAVFAASSGSPGLVASSTAEYIANASAPGFIPSDETKLTSSVSSVVQVDQNGIPGFDVGGTLVPVWVFGIAALLLVSLFGLALGTSRAFYLEGRGLLKLKGFLCIKAFSLPLVLAVSAEVLLLLAGLLLFAILQSFLVLLACIFLPALMGLLLRVVTQWVKNDYSLLEPAERRPALSPEYRAAIKARAAEAEAAERGVAVAVVLREQRRAAAAEARDARALAASKKGGGLDLSIVDRQAAAQAVEGADNKALGILGAPDLDDPDEDDDLGEDAEPVVGVSLADVAGSNGKRKNESRRSSLTLRQRYNRWLAKLSDPRNVSDWDAFWAGFLTKTDYGTIGSMFGLLAGLCLFGGLVVLTVDNVWLGHFLYAAPIDVLLTVMAVIKMFQTYKMTWDAAGYLALALIAHVGLCAGLFAGPIGADPGDPRAISLFVALLGWPMLVLTVGAYYAWADNQWYMPRISKVTLGISAPLWILLVLIIFGWWSYAAGAGFAILLLFALYGTYLLRVWASNDFFLPEPHPSILGILITVCAVLAIVVAAAAADIDTFFPLSMACVFLILLLGGRAFAGFSALPPGSRVLVAPFLFPVYALNPATSTLSSMTGPAADALVAWCIALLWGLIATMLAEPLDAGVAIACMVIVIGSIMAATVAGDAALRLGRAAVFADEDVLRVAGDRARESFFARRRALDVHCEEFVKRDDLEAAQEANMLAGGAFGGLGGAVRAAKVSADERAKKREQLEAAVLTRRDTAFESSERLARRQWEQRFAWPWEPDAVNGEWAPTPPALAELSDDVGKPTILPSLRRGGPRGVVLREGRILELTRAFGWEERARELAGKAAAFYSDSTQAAAAAWAGALGAPGSEQDRKLLEEARFMTAAERRRRGWTLHRWLATRALVLPYPNRVDPTIQSPTESTPSGGKVRPTLEDAEEGTSASSARDGELLGGALLAKASTDSDGEEVLMSVRASARAKDSKSGVETDGSRKGCCGERGCCCGFIGGPGCGWCGKAVRGVRRPRDKAELSVFVPARREDGLMTLGDALRDLSSSGGDAPLSWVCGRGTCRLLCRQICQLVIFQALFACCGILTAALSGDSTVEARAKRRQRVVAARQAAEAAARARRKEDERRAIQRLKAEEDGAEPAGDEGDEKPLDSGRPLVSTRAAPLNALDAALEAQDAEVLSPLQEFRREAIERKGAASVFDTLLRAEAAMDDRAKKEVDKKHRTDTGQMSVLEHARTQADTSAIISRPVTPGNQASDEGGAFDDLLENPDAAPPDAGTALRGLFDSIVTRPSALRRGGWHKSIDMAGSLRDVWDAADSLAREYYEETRLFAHFSLLVLAAADARLQSESVLFRRFLREYQTELRDAGVAPPPHVFSSASFASLDIALVATWLQTLTPEQRQRFRDLRQAFSAGQKERLLMQRKEDRDEEQRAMRHLQSLKPRETDMAKKRAQEFAQRRAARKRAGIIGDSSAAAPEAEADENDKEMVHEIEQGHKFCSPGEFGREWQFRDPDFPANEHSVGEAKRAGDVVGWRPAIALNPGAGLFKDGTDPDDVFVGLLEDNWFLSALSIVAASGGVEDGEVDLLISNLFVTAETTETGMYAVRFYKNAQWETVIVDDFFPIVYDVAAEEDEDEDEDEDAPRGRAQAGPRLTDLDPDTLAIVRRGRGVAFAHSGEMNEIWVPVIEKAYAKYHGTYASIETGFVQHALTDLTGADAEEIFLSENRTGAAKLQLWANLQRWQRNGFLLGAGTVSRAASDKQLQDSGLVFGAVYVVYEAVEVDGQRLLKLRNPPGDHGEWQGDWSDNSPLWTARLRAKLGVVDDADDGTFWMSVDDFVFAFRSLYLCRWFDPGRWNTEIVTGFWKGPTAAGLPSRHNPHCRLADNPQFSLIIERPTDVAITLTQALPGVPSRTHPHPVAVFIVAQFGSSQSEIHDRQRRKRIEREQQQLGLLKMVQAASVKAEQQTRKREDGEEDDEEYAARMQREAIAREGGAEDAQLYAEVEAELRREYEAAAFTGKAIEPPTDKEIRRRMKAKRKELQAIRRTAIDRAKAAKEEAEEAAWEEEQRMQVLAGLGRETTASAAAVGGAVALKAERAHTLTAANVVASSGHPVRQREVRCYTSLAPGAYTVLVAAYQRGMEGPFTLTLRSNYAVEFQGLWPPSRSEGVTHEYASSSPIVRMGKWFGRTWKRLHESIVGEDPAEAAARQEEEADAEAAFRAMETAAAEAEVDAGAAAAEATTVWVEQVDVGTGRSYWYNGETGESQFEMPEEIRIARGEVKASAAEAEAIRHDERAIEVGKMLGAGLTMSRSRSRARNALSAAASPSGSVATPAGDGTSGFDSTAVGDAKSQEPATTAGADDAKSQEPATTAVGDAKSQEPATTAGADDAKSQEPATTAGADDAKSQEPATTAGADDAKP